MRYEFNYRKAWIADGNPSLPLILAAIRCQGIDTADEIRDRIATKHRVSGKTAKWTARAAAANWNGW